MAVAGISMAKKALTNTKSGGRGHYLAIASVEASRLKSLLKSALACKAAPNKIAKSLAGKSVICIYEKPSLRTRVSFEVGIAGMGGHPIYYDTKDQQIGVRESLVDVAKNLGRMVDGIVARVYQQATLDGLAQHSGVPVINALSNDHHPCQALADVLTICERWGKIKGVRVCYVGDGNNVARSLSQAVCKLGGLMTVITPAGYGLPAEDVEACQAEADSSGGAFTQSNETRLVASQQVVYTDEWSSMHHADGPARASNFARYQVNSALLSKADKKAIFMHCLPAARGQEVTDGVIDGPQSVVYDQAENRIYAQQAVLLDLLAGRR